MAEIVLGVRSKKLSARLAVGLVHIFNFLVAH